MLGELPAQLRQVLLLERRGREAQRRFDAPQHILAQIAGLGLPQLRAGQPGLAAAEVALNQVLDRLAVDRIDGQSLLEVALRAEQVAAPAEMLRQRQCVGDVVRSPGQRRVVFGLRLFQLVQAGVGQAKEIMGVGQFGGCLQCGLRRLLRLGPAKLLHVQLCPNEVCQAGVRAPRRHGRRRRRRLVAQPFLEQSLRQVDRVRVRAQEFRPVAQRRLGSAGVAPGECQRERVGGGIGIGGEQRLIQRNGLRVRLKLDQARCDGACRLIDAGLCGLHQRIAPGGQRARGPGGLQCNTQNR